MARLTPKRRAISRWLSPPGTTGIERLAGLVLGPGAGPLVGADDHAGHAVIDARALPGRPRSAGRPSGRGSPAAGRTSGSARGRPATGISGGRSMSRSSSASRALARAAAFLAGQQAGGVAGVEQDHAALRQIGLDRARPARRRDRDGRAGPASRAAGTEPARRWRCRPAMRLARPRSRCAWPGRGSGPRRPASLSLVDVGRCPSRHRRAGSRA